MDFKYKYLKYKKKYLELKKLEKITGGSLDTLIKRFKESSELNKLKKKILNEIIDPYTCIKVENPLHYKEYDDYLNIKNIKDLSELKKAYKNYTNEKNESIRKIWELRKRKEADKVIPMTNARMK